MQFRILLGPVPSLHELRRSRGRFVRSLLCYFGKVRLLPRTHRRLRPPAFPTRSQPRPVGTAMEVSRSPGGRLLRTARVCDDAGPARISRSRHGPSRLLLDGKHQRPELVLRRSIPGLTHSLSTLRLQPHDRTRMTRGWCSSLRPHRDGLAPPTFRSSQPWSR